MQQKQHKRVGNGEMSLEREQVYPLFTPRHGIRQRRCVREKIRNFQYELIYVGRGRVAKGRGSVGALRQG